MIYYYSTLIQFVAAIYVTLSFDNWLFKSLWSMSYAKLINERVETLFKVSSSAIEKHLMDSVSNNAALIEKRSRLRGFFCLLYCSATLWYVGYEQNCLSLEAAQDEIDTFHLSFSAFTLLSAVGFLAVCIWATRLLHAFEVCVLLMVGFVLLNCLDLSVCLNSDVVLHFVRNLNLYCSILIVLPLLYQIILTWLYSDNYYYILGANIRKEYEYFQAALDAESAEEVPPNYNEAIAASYFDSKKGKSIDTGVTNITKVFRKRLQEVTSVPSSLELVKYAVKHCFSKRIDELDNINVTSQIKGEELPPKDVLEKKKNSTNGQLPGLHQKKRKRKSSKRSN